MDLRGTADVWPRGAGGAAGVGRYRWSVLHLFDRTGTASAVLLRSSQAGMAPSRRTWVACWPAAIAALTHQERLSGRLLATHQGDNMKITDLKCAVIGDNPIIRVVTDEGIDGYGEIENSKPYVKPQVLYYKQFIVGEDPTNVEGVVSKIRRLGAFKPWGSAVSAIEMALWDIAGKASGLPIYKLLGGKVRDRVRTYNTGGYVPIKDQTPESYAEIVARQKASPEGFTMVKQGIGFHSGMPQAIPGFTYGEVRTGPAHINKGLLTEKGLKHVIACAEAMKSVLGDEVGLALDCGPGWMVPDAIKLARALEPLNLMWLEDLITGDYSPHVSASVYREVTQATSTPIHTGEQIYLRQNFLELIEGQAVRAVGPDPLDVGGLAELKWIAEDAG